MEAAARPKLREPKATPALEGVLQGLGIVEIRKVFQNNP